MKALMLENFAFILDISFSKYDMGLGLLNAERKKLEAASPQTRSMLTSDEERPKDRKYATSLLGEAGIQSGKKKKVVRKRGGSPDEKRHSDPV